ALIAELVGAEGSATTVDIDQEIVTRAGAGGSKAACSRTVPTLRRSPSGMSSCCVGGRASIVDAALHASTICRTPPRPPTPPGGMQPRGTAPSAGPEAPGA